MSTSDALVTGIVNNKADHFMTSDNALLRLEMVKCMRSEILFCKNSSGE
jgi:hypothetical protein